MKLEHIHSSVFECDNNIRVVVVVVVVVVVALCVEVEH